MRIFKPRNARIYMEPRSRGGGMNELWRSVNGRHGASSIFRFAASVSRCGLCRRRRWWWCYCWLGGWGRNAIAFHYVFTCSYTYPDFGIVTAAAGDVPLLLMSFIVWVRAHLLLVGPLVGGLRWVRCVYVLFLFPRLLFSLSSQAK